MSFTLIHQDKFTKARVGKLTLPHGEVTTPCFMPVGTQASVKALSPRDLDDCKAQMILANTYHLYLRPGMDVIKKAGGLHKFMGWTKPILTDSGGYQVFSLSSLRKISDNGVEFQSHLDGSRHFFTPEKVVELQLDFGSDIIMPLDECVHYPATRDYSEQSLKLTNAWARRSKIVHQHTSAPVHQCTSAPAASYGKRQLLFGIAQGATYKDLRKRAVEELIEIGFDGYAVGGLSVGEPKEILYEMLEYTAPLLPQDKPHYLMGVGTPLDLLEVISHGIDMFDCVIPTRYGRSGTAFTREGKLVVRNAEFAFDMAPLDKSCGCYTCRSFSRAYLRHLFNADELLGLYLLSLHNIYFYDKLMQDVKAAIEGGIFFEFKNNFIGGYREDATERIRS